MFNLFYIVRKKSYGIKKIEYETHYIEGLHDLNKKGEQIYVKKNSTRNIKLIRKLLRFIL